MPHTPGYDDLLQLCNRRNTLVNKLNKARYWFTLGNE